MSFKNIFLFAFIALSLNLIGQNTEVKSFDGFFDFTETTPAFINQCGDPSDFSQILEFDQNISELKFEIQFPADILIGINNVIVKDENDNTINLAGGVHTFDNNLLVLNFGDREFLSNSKITISYEVSSLCQEMKDIKESNKNNTTITFSESTDPFSYESQNSYSIKLPSIQTTALGNPDPEFLGDYVQSFQIENLSGASSVNGLQLTINYDDENSSDYVTLKEVVLEAEDLGVIKSINFPINSHEATIVLDETDFGNLGLETSLDENEKITVKLHHFITGGFKEDGNNILVTLDAKSECGSDYCNGDDESQFLKYNYDKSKQDVNIATTVNQAELCESYTSTDDGAFIDVVIENKGVTGINDPFFIIDNISVGHTANKKIKVLKVTAKSVIDDSDLAIVPKYTSDETEIDLKNKSNIGLSELYPGSGVFNTLKNGEKINLRLYYEIGCDNFYLQQTSFYFDIKISLKSAPNDYNTLNKELIVLRAIHGKKSLPSPNLELQDKNNNKVSIVAIEDGSKSDTHFFEYKPGGINPSIGGTLLKCSNTSQFKTVIEYPTSFTINKVWYKENNYESHIEIKKESLAKVGDPYYKLDYATNTINIFNPDKELKFEKGIYYSLEGVFTCSALGNSSLNFTTSMWYNCGSSYCEAECWKIIRDRKTQKTPLKCVKAGGLTCYTEITSFDIERTTSGKKLISEIDKNPFYKKSELNSSDFIDDKNKNKLISGDYLKITALGKYTGIPSCEPDFNNLSLYIPNFKKFAKVSKEIASNSKLIFGGETVIGEWDNINEIVYFPIKNSANLINSPGGWKVEINCKSKHTELLIRNRVAREPTNLDWLYNMSFEIYKNEFINQEQTKQYTSEESLIIFPNKIDIETDEVQVNECELTHNTDFLIISDKFNRETYKGNEVRPFGKLTSIEYTLSSDFKDSPLELELEIYKNSDEWKDGSSNYSDHNQTLTIPLKFTTNTVGEDIKLTVQNIDDIELLNYDIHYSGKTARKSKIASIIFKSNLSSYAGNYSVVGDFKFDKITDINDAEVLKETLSLDKSMDLNLNSDDLNIDIAAGEFSKKDFYNSLPVSWALQIRTDFSTYSKKMSDYIWVLFQKTSTEENKQIFVDNINFNGKSILPVHVLDNGSYLAFFDVSSMNSSQTKNFSFDIKPTSCASGEDIKFKVKIGTTCNNSFSGRSFSEEGFVDEKELIINVNKPKLQGLNLDGYNKDGTSLEKINICDEFSFKIEPSNISLAHLYNSKIKLGTPTGLEVQKVELSYTDGETNVTETKTLNCNLCSLTVTQSTSEIKLSEHISIPEFKNGDNLTAEVFYKGDCGFKFQEPLIIGFEAEDLCGKIVSELAERKIDIKDFDEEKLKITDKINGLEILDEIGASTNINFSYLKDDIDGWGLIQESRVQLNVPQGLELVKSDFVFNKGSNSSAKFSETFNSDGSTSYEWEGVDWSTDHELAFNGKFKYVGSFVNKSAKIIAKIGVKAELKCGSKTCKEWVDINEKDVKLVPISENPVDCEDCITSFSPLKYKKYVVSAWVSESSNIGKTNFDHAQLNVFIQDNDGPPSGSPKYTFSPSGQVIDGWQRIEGVFEIDNPNAMRIHLQFENQSNSQGLYLDDVRVSPANSTFVTYVYDPLTLRLAAELDEHNYATIYEYDEEGALIRVKKESERGIQTIRESRNNMKRR